MNKNTGQNRGESTYQTVQVGASSGESGDKSTKEPVIQIEAVSKIFAISQGFFRGKKPLQAVNNVSLEVAKGDVLGLVGESGCGKSTLAMITLGLLDPTSGNITFQGRPLSKWSNLERTRKIQPIFQDPYSSLNPRKTVGQIVGALLRVHKINNHTQWRQETQKLLEVVGLPRRVFNCYPNQLSGGQRQRVAIARALIMKPDVVVCDEPTSALDVSVQSQILNLLLDLQREYHLTYLFISHDLAVIEHLANRVAVMYLGRIVEEAHVDDIFRRPRHPYTKALLSSVLPAQPGKGLPENQLGAAYPNPIDPPDGCTFHPRCSQAFNKCRTVPPELVGGPDGRVACHYFDKYDRYEIWGES